jgi:hypothetical protein
MPIQIGMADYRIEVSMVYPPRYRALTCGELLQPKLCRVRAEMEPYPQAAISPNSAVSCTRIGVIRG